MDRIIKIKIQGSGADTDAPTAEDMLDQIRDYLDILHGVEGAVAEDGHIAIDWRVVGASRKSPVTIELQPYAREYGTDISRRATAVAARTSEGLTALGKSPERPPFFPEDVIKKAAKTYQRVTNGLCLSEIDFGEGISSIVVTPLMARNAVKNAELALNPVDKPYKELGSLEGLTRGVEIDGYGRRILYVRHRVTGTVIKCVLQGAALSAIGEFTVGRLLLGTRVKILGTIRYKSLGNIMHMEASEIFFAQAKPDLPSVDDILDEGFTGGLRTEAFLEGLRDGRPS